LRSSSSKSRRHWRSWFAGAWHYLALVMITAGWIVWASGARNGIGGLRLLIGTVAVLVAARLIAILLLGLLDRAVQFGRGKADQHPGLQARAVRYQAPARIEHCGLYHRVANGKKRR